MKGSRERRLPKQASRRCWSTAQIAISWVVVAFLLAGIVDVDKSTKAGTCPPVQNTLKYTIVYGDLMVDDQPATGGTMVEARNGDGIAAGCFVVTTAGSYGAMYVYGEDTSVSPPIPGMRPGETIAFYVDSVEATSTPQLTWSNDKELHQVDLSAEGVGPPCYDFNDNGVVDSGDIALIAGAWRNTDSASLDLYNFNDNLVVDVGDIQTVAAHWGEESPC